MPNTAFFWVDKLQMLPHPEGGFYKETFRSDLQVDGGWGVRSALTSIFYLLEGDDFSGFHRIKSSELWYHHAGGILLVHEINPEGILKTHQLSAENPFAAIQPNSWFASEVADKNNFVLVSCAVAPGFDFADFELAKRSEIVQEFPAHAELLARLCRQ